MYHSERQGHKRGLIEETVRTLVILIIPNSQREGGQDRRKASRSKNKPYVYRIKIGSGLGITIKEVIEYTLFTRILSE